MFILVLLLVFSVNCGETLLNNVTDNSVDISSTNSLNDLLPDSSPPTKVLATTTESIPHSTSCLKFRDNSILNTLTTETQLTETSPSEITSPDTFNAQNTNTDISTPDSTSSDITTSDNLTSEITTADSTNLDTTTLSHTTPKTTITSPDTPNPQNTITDITTPDSTSPDITTSDNLTSEITTADSTNLDTTTLNYTSPDTTTPDYTSPDTTTPDYTTPNPTIPNTDAPETTETTASQTSRIPTTPYESTTDETTTTGASSTPAPIDKSSAILLGILIPVLVIGVSVILWMGYRSGRITWPPKYLSSDTPDNVRPSYVALKKFPAHCEQMLEVPSKLTSEFEFLKTLSDDIIYRESFIAAQMPDNKVKNRYTNILPYDSTRVKLIPEGNDFFSDYINASYIKGYTNEIEYIATQGPKEETSRDFWRMIYQEPVKVIVMVTQFEEMGRPKCHKYFPNLRENMVLDDITIWCTTELHFPIYTSRTLVLTKDDRKRSITHLHFREWPDFGCPSTPELMLQFCQVMRQHITVAQPGITVVHCSAGVGRTGTLIAVDILLQQMNENKKISVFDTVYKLRKHRVSMVQSEAQYAYIYKCLKEALENPSYVASENSSSSSMEPIYENIECTQISPSTKIPAEVINIESEFAF